MELLVVIAIIGILAAVVLASLRNARAKSLDAEHSSDMELFEAALESYYSDHGNYPYSTCALTDNWSSFDSPTYSGNQVCAIDGGSGQTLTQAMAPYMPKISDPASLGTDSGYLYINNLHGANDYCILFWRTPQNLNDFPATQIPATRCTAWDTAGQCTAGTNSIFFGRGAYVGGC